jgi:nitrate reductase NapAB chaperone NapD
MNIKNLKQGLVTIVLDSNELEELLKTLNAIKEFLPVLEASFMEEFRKLLIKSTETEND